jgi:hypothetical protein
MRAVEWLASLLSSQSAAPNGVYKLEAHINRWKTQFEILRLTECEIGQLYRVFKDADITRKKLIKTSHLISYLKVEKNLFAKRMLSSFKNGVPFEGFVFEVWDICTVDEADLGEILYYLLTYYYLLLSSTSFYRMCAIFLFSISSLTFDLSILSSKKSSS